MTKPDEPVFAGGKVHHDLNGNPIWVEPTGLTKREYFAAMAMQGLLPNYRTERSQEGDEALAFLAVKMADALIVELKKENP